MSDQEEKIAKARQRLLDGMSTGVMFMQSRRSKKVLRAPSTSADFLRGKGVIMLNDMPPEEACAYALKRMGLTT